MLRRCAASIIGLWRRESIHQEIAAERAFHIEMRAAELIQRGMEPARAWEESRRSFGREARAQEEAFDVRGGGVLEDFWLDARLAWRMLLRAPLKTAALVATVALVIGMDVAAFSFINAVVFSPLPFYQSSRLLVIHQLSKGKPEGVSYPNFEDWRQMSRSFAGMAVYATDSAALQVSGAPARRVFGAVVSPNLFSVLEVTPLRGRLFSEYEGAPHSEPVALISDELWRSQFGRREEVLGQSIRLDAQNYRILGIIPAALAFPVQKEPLSYWITLAGDAEPTPWGSIRTSRGYPRYDAALARLRPGVTVESTGVEMAAISGKIAAANPRFDLQEGVRVSPAIDDVVGNVRPLFWMLFGAVSCVLAVGFANTATLLLVDTVARAKEFAVRAALGAKPARLVRQVLVESSLISLAGFAGGILLAQSLARGLVRVAPPETPRLSAVHLDSVTLAYAVAVSFLSGLVFSLAPVLAVLRHDLAGTFKGGMNLPGRRFRFGGITPATLLIAGQIAVSMVLCCAAAALTSSFWRILHAPRGFDPEHVLTASLHLPPSFNGKGSATTVFYQELLERLRLVPGVVSASAAQSLPLSGQNNSTEIQTPGEPNQAHAATDLRFVDPAYFRTLRIPLLQGRLPAAADRAGMPAIVVVNRTFAAMFLPHGAVGASVQLGWGGTGPKRVVGVVGDIRHDALGTEARPEAYVPLAQFPVTDLSLVVRTEGDNRGAAHALRDVVNRMDPAVIVEHVRTLEEFLLLSASPERLLMWLLAGFAGGTVLLAGVGLYGSLSYATVCRRHEFGIRMALGSEPRDLIWVVLRKGVVVAAAGVLTGLSISLASGPLLRDWLFQTSPVELKSLLCAGALLMAMAAVACWIPARRATLVDPTISLHGE